MARNWEEGERTSLKRRSTKRRLGKWAGVLRRNCRGEKKAWGILFGHEACRNSRIGIKSRCINAPGKGGRARIGRNGYSKLRGKSARPGKEGWQKKRRQQGGSSKWSKKLGRERCLRGRKKGTAKDWATGQNKNAEAANGKGTKHGISSHQRGLNGGGK